MVNEKDVLEICKLFNVLDGKITSFIDSSKNEEDQRYNYIIDDKYVLKMNTNGTITEKFLDEVNSLQEKYRSIDVYCPKLYKSNEGVYLISYSKNNEDYQCYMEEFAPYKTARSVVETYEGKLDMLGHVGKLASKYTNFDLVDTRSMWSIIDLAPLDDEIDEKQDNLNGLIELLQEKSFDELANQLVIANKEARETIQIYFDELPRCVYQGDLNPSNVLVDDDGKFVGIIDFNLFGTEVNINCFLNECMYYLEETDFETLSALEIFTKMNDIQEKLLSKIWKYYVLNDVEKKCFDAYKKLIDISFYPNVELMKYYLEEGKEVNKVLELITLLIGNK